MQGGKRALLAVLQQCLWQEPRGARLQQRFRNVHVPFYHCAGEVLPGQCVGGDGERGGARTNSATAARAATLLWFHAINF
jgi:hypothetical protein